MEQPSGGREILPAQFIFGPFGDGYRLTRTERRISDAIGLAFVIPACALAVLLKMELVGAGLGLGGGAALAVAAFVAMKLYVSLAGVPKIKRPFAEKLLANVSHRRDFFIYGLPISLGLLCIIPAAALAFTEEADVVLGWLLAVTVALLIGSLVLRFWIKRRLPERDDAPLD